MFSPQLRFAGAVCNREAPQDGVASLTIPELNYTSLLVPVYDRIFRAAAAFYCDCLAAKGNPLHIVKGHYKNGVSICSRIDSFLNG